MGKAFAQGGMMDHLSDEQLRREMQRIERDNDLGALRARVAQLEALLKDCADELEEQVEARYAKTKPHLERQYERDIDPVRQARLALKD